MLSSPLQSDNSRDELVNKYTRVFVFFLFCGWSYPLVRPPVRLAAPERPFHKREGLSINQTDVFSHRVSTPKAERGHGLIERCSVYYKAA